MDLDGLHSASGRGMVARTLEELFVYRRSLDLLVRIIAITDRSDVKSHRRFCEEWLEATESVSKNTAEGFGRVYPGDFARFVSVARGSLYEVRTMLKHAEIKGLVPDSEAQELLGMIKQIDLGLARLFAYLRREARRQRKC